MGINAALFVATAASINTLTALLSPVALAVIMSYSYCKRFTSLAHLVLGLSLGIAPVGAYIAVTGHFAGFDIIYALQDREFDRAHGLHSIPARFPVATALGISIALHAASVAALVWFVSLLPRSVWITVGAALFASILIAEHILVTPRRQTDIGIAFGTLNGLAGLVLAALVVVGLLTA